MWNAHGISSVVSDELDRARRLDHPFTTIVIGLDQIGNTTTYGRFPADAALARIANILLETVRDNDIVGRCGDEEFIIGCPQTSGIQAQAIAEQIRIAVDQAAFELPTSPTPIKFSVSLGLACFPQDAVTLDDLVHEANVALYQAKHLGGNRLVYAADVPHYIKLEHSISARKHILSQAIAITPERPAIVNPNGERHSISASDHQNNTVIASSEEQATLIPIRNHAPPNPAVASSQAHTTSMSRWAWRYIWAVLALGFGLSAYACSTFAISSAPWLVFGVLFTLATIAQLNKVDGPNHLLFHATPLFFFAGVLLLPPFLLLPLILGPHLFQLAKERWLRSPHLRDWYLQPFNVAMYLIAAFSAQWVYKHFVPAMPSSLTLPAIMIIMAAAAIYILTNNAILGYALLLARGVSWKQSGVLKVENLLPEFIMACLGVVVAWLWVDSPWLILPALSPLVLMYRALMIPLLQAENMKKLQRVNEELSAANSVIQQVNDELFLTLAKIFDARDPYVGGHAAQVAMYAVAIANELRLPTERVDIIRQSAYLHDIGKIAIPETILHKPSKLTTEEFEIMKNHAAIGAEFLETSQGLRHLAPFVRYHHERWDGRGYPSGLAGEDIPLESRILNVCDSVEAMASDRPYHKGMSVDEIIVEISRCSGTQFDPSIANAFIRIAERNGSHFIRNSAREVERSYANVQDALFFAKIYKQVA